MNHASFIKYSVILCLTIMVGQSVYSQGQDNDLSDLRIEIIEDAEKQESESAPVLVEPEIIDGFTKWVAGDLEAKYLNVNPFRYTNRARCAADATLPTKKVFLLLNNTTAAHAVYRVAQYQNKKSKGEVTLYAIEVYRRSVLQLFNHIAKELLEGKLPLLTEEGKGVFGKRKTRFHNIQKKCTDSNLCPELNEYISEIWNGREYKEVLESIDFFTKKNYLQKKKLDDSSRGIQQSCMHLKQFSSLQSQLYGSVPSGGIVYKIGQTYNSLDKVVGSCDDVNASDDKKVMLFQWELVGLNKKWKKVGFDFWRSLKIYFSWAYRYSDLYASMAYPFADIFQAIDIEDQFMLVPFGCKSLSTPECNNQELSQNSLRLLAKKDTAGNLKNSDFVKEVPDGPQKQLILDPFTKVNRDNLNLKDFDSANEWYNNYRKHFVGVQGPKREKLRKALVFQKILLSKINGTKIAKDIEMQFAPLLKGEKPEASSGYWSKSWAQDELYYLCGEYLQGFSQEFSYLRKNILLLAEKDFLNRLLPYVEKPDLEKTVAELETLNQSIGSLCKTAYKKEIWEEKTPDKGGYKDWYLDSMFSDPKSVIPLGEVAISDDEREEEYLKNSAPYLKTVYAANGGENILCSHPSACARNLLQTTFDMYSTMIYASSLFQSAQGIPSSEFFNPYHERVACNVYDPWFKTRRTVFRAVTDLALAGLTPSIPALFFFDWDLSKKRVKSLKRIIEDGQITYAPDAKKQNIDFSLATELGPLFGIPCEIAIKEGNGGMGSIGYDYYKFLGYGVSACVDNNTSTVKVEDPGEISEKDGLNVKGCVSCTLNFEKVASSTAFIAGSGLDAALFGSLNFAASLSAPVYYLVRGVVRLFRGLRDPVNIPRTYTINPNYVHQTWRQYGGIPNRCIDQLKKGKRCHRNICEENLMDKLESLGYLEVTSWKVPETGGKRAEFKMKGCEEAYSVKMSKLNYNGMGCKVIGKVQVPETCGGENE